MQTRDLFGIPGDVDASELRVLSKVYSAGLDVNYKLLHFDLTDGHRSRAIEGPLWEIAARDRIRIKNFFTDYDRMRSGRSIKTQFMRAVTLLHRVFSLCKLIDSPLRQNLLNTKLEMRLVLAFNKVFTRNVSTERELVKALEATTTISEAAQPALSSLKRCVYY
ncbi:hypothetical protein SPRG_15240 [Saprolegnia parasitica CBS 223.65]|uniref:Uncharacterized protein n=1 Tax=Saprolegnia parasitica (strain CBS 223.65) TaxID=695850 RepID=A0A067BMY5_SAPPC|nr:hypothetical protein SPRG_15240 [Saprolegnia parasitica CBS 223.65]KDO19588.1 hypothetical protein SPRG_15240 [Saprolegnia parasitica CBS 223.65]|eukprot:XP_012209686.1 hypothetical protein SPRG_15240 [Saprolegnia parasitica CBS 223.65]